MTEDIQSLMSEIPGGWTPEEGIPAGFGVVDTLHDAGSAGGMVAHRGVLTGDEYIDQDELRASIEASLGYSYDDVSSAYKIGRPTPEQRQLRERIDSRLLALSRSGGNMTILGGALALGHSTIEKAIKRAKEREVAPVVKNPAVVTRRVSFMTGLEGATARKRRFSKSPPQWVGTINLSDAEYLAGFEQKPGSPAYWAHRDAR